MNYFTPNQNQIQAYFEQGFDAIPLKPNTKAALFADWQKTSPAQQWGTAPANANIGLRAGNGKAFIDADDKNQPGASEAVMNWLAGLGYSRGTYPTVRTPNHGTHIYVNFAGDFGKQYANLKITAGEFRAGNGAYVVAPPSIVAEGRYQLEGNLSQLPTLDMLDIASLVDLSHLEPATAPAKPAGHMPRPSWLAGALMKGEGEAIARYGNDRSRAEFALMLSLVHSGYEFAQIRYIFENYPCAGKYAELKKDSVKRAEDWLTLTYRNALSRQGGESQTRQALARLREQTAAEAWQNVNAKAVYLAHVDTAYTVGQGTYRLSARDAALKAGLGLKAAASHTKKLVEAGRLSLVKAGNVESAAIYALQMDNQQGQKETSLYTSPAPVKTCFPLSIVQHEAFRAGGKRLGKRAGELYALLLAQPMTESELATATGAHVKTIRRALAKLAYKVIDRTTGELIQLVEKDGGSGAWSANRVDLDRVAWWMGTAGATEKQRRQYEKDRRAHRAELEAYKRRQQDGQP